MLVSKESPFSYMSSSSLFHLDGFLDVVFNWEALDKVVFLCLKVEFVECQACYPLNAILQRFQLSFYWFHPPNFVCFWYASRYKLVNLCIAEELVLLNASK